MMFTAPIFKATLAVTAMISLGGAIVQAQEAPAKKASNRAEIKFSDPAQDTPAQAEARKAIIKQSQMLNEAARKLDVSGVLQICSPEYESRDVYGLVRDRADFETYTRQMFASKDLKVESSQTKIEGIQWVGKEAVVWSSSNVKLKFGPAEVGGNGTTRSVWHNVGGQWRVKRSVELTQQNTINGKKLPVQKAVGV